MPTKSEDFLNLRGSNDLVIAGKPDLALKYLYAMKAKRPYWTEARVKLISVLMSLGRYTPARPELDTVLMLEPYKREYHMINYTFWRDQRKYTQAFEAIERTLELFPDDPEILTDLMLSHHDVGNRKEAAALASSLNATDSTLPYPYLIRAFQEDAKENYSAAIQYYEKFISLSPPNNPDADRIRQRLNELTDKLSE
jgi:tetratricopeptide (TPR) repeat protein